MILACDLLTSLLTLLLTILKDSTKFKTSTMYSKVFISPDRTPEERIEHSELVREMKSKIQSDSSKHWKINKGKVVSVEIETPEVIAEQETSVKIESPEENYYYDLNHKSLLCLISFIVLF